MDKENKMDILNNQIFLLLLITLIGMTIGKINIKNFSLDSSAIIFVGLFFGHFGYTLPKTFQTLGLVLFIYSIGLQAGPGFFFSLRQRGLKLSLGTVAIIGIGFLTTLATTYLFHFSAGTSAGIFTGALTSTPGLAVAVEIAGGQNAPAAYGVTYFFGIVGVIVFIQIIPKILNITVKDEEQALNKERDKTHKPLHFMHLELTNLNLVDRQVKHLNLKSISPVIITRLLRKNGTEPILVGGQTILQAGDHLRITGTKDDLEMMQMYLGTPVDQDIEFERVLSGEYITVSNKDICGMSLKQLNCHEVFNVQLSRISRNGIELPAGPNLRLHMGDTIHAVGSKQSLENIKKIFGNSIKDSYNFNILPIFTGLFLGFILGKIPLYIPFSGIFYLGTTGGVLIAGLFLSNIYKTGPLIWAIPSNANSFIREMGLVLFMATIGTQTGTSILATLRHEGLQLSLAGILVTTVPLISSVFICKHLLKLPFLSMLGVITGAMTSTPGLATMAKISKTPYATSSYATVYPVALISMIIYTKLLIFIVERFF
ncbi:conserved hypothetical membrane protein [Desulfotalea psychrophila LSv54]|uniref:Uncharacterized transporter DP0976 n=2 Tax=Desulfotalea psychrophila TaxID=84980 RepID=Y976_DESPS|nr:RecName: Full=Uncharacterized transporter DP0976 [Desulfotalea psychrophila LSv54]CAG35705.1 conserved hypothetical membrane protein [Desulfotalea psychrophila LSv54]